jgi:hypothetical protein
MLTENPNEPWSNWASTQALTPYRHCHPQTPQDLVTVVRDAEAAGKRVRAVGSSWSFPDIAVTGDYLVETDQLNHILTMIVPGALNPTGRALHLVHVEAGIKVVDLCSILDSMGLALSTMGGADGQSVAGILSTAVHGPDFNRGPVPDMVRAVHLVGPGGIQHWIERSMGITDPVALRAALPAVNIHYDDQWFNAAIATVGTLGLVYSVIIEVESQYDISETITVSDWPSTRAMLMDPGTFRFVDRGLQVALDPGPGHACFLYKRMTAPATKPADYQIFNDPLGLFCTTAVADALVGIPGGAALFLSAAAILIPLLPPPLDLIYGTMLVTGTATALAVAPLVGLLRTIKPGALGDVVASALNGNPMMTAQVVTSVTRSNIKLGTHQGFAHTIMSGPKPGECAMRGLACELAFDTTDGSHLAFVDEALPLLDIALTQEGLAVAGWFSLRFVGRSRAYLAPQNRCDRTCMIEIMGLRGFTSTPVILDRLEALGRKHGAIQHWGMFRNLTRADVERAYPGLNDWRRIRWQITNNGALRTFDNDFSVRVGLSNPPVDVSYLTSLLLSEPPVRKLRPRKKLQAEPKRRTKSKRKLSS